MSPPLPSLLAALALCGLVALSGCDTVDQIVYDHELTPTTAGELDEVELEAGEPVWLVVGVESDEGISGTGVSIKLRGHLERVDASGAEPIPFDVWTMEPEKTIFEGRFDDTHRRHRRFTFDDKSDWVVYALHELEAPDDGTWRIVLDEVEFRTPAGEADVWIGFATLRFDTGSIGGLIVPIVGLAVGAIFGLIWLIQRMRAPKYW